MNGQKNGVNLLLVAEAFLLVVVLVFGIVSGAAGIIQSDTEDTEDGGMSENSEHENWAGSEGNSETESESESETGSEDNWVIPESYVDSRMTFSDSVEAKLAQMSIEEKVAQLFVVTPEALTGYDQVTVFGNASKNAFMQYPIGGLVYSAWNYQGDVQIQELVQNAQEYYVTTFGMKLFTINREGVASPITAKLDEQALLYNVLLKDGVMPTMPEEYNGIIEGGASVIVLDNASASGLTGDETTPCCLSNRMVGLLRETLGYEGLLMTDVLLEESFVESHGTADACVDAIIAGVDILYLPADFVNSYNAVLQAVVMGDISMDRLDNAVGRILTAKGV